MSDSDESNFGALLFGDAADEVPPEYPIETLVVDRLQNMREGTTNGGFQPLYRCFDSLNAPQQAGAGGERVDDVETQLVRLSERLTSLHPPPLAVHYRNKHHSLWGHRLWNAAKYLSKRMDQRCIDVRGKTVLELGAGLGVPSLVAYRNGASVVVVTDYPDADLLDVIQLNVDENCKPELVDADAQAEVDKSSNCDAAVEGERTSALPPSAAVVAVEPLLWGRSEHIQKVMSYTGGSGFDVVILSDILFNHVCNDDLVDTLLRTLSHAPASAGYCVFSHHRAYKQLQDFEFFDKCVARGLMYEQVDEQAYPMMFPEDRGPEEVRMPVKCFKITRRYDRVGAPLDLTSVFDNFAKMAVMGGGSGGSGDAARAFGGGTPCFDAVVQGTGLVQSLLAAALARSGLRVLHCDGESVYGGAQATLTVDQLIAYLKRMEVAEGEAAEKDCERHLYTRPHVPGTEHPRVRVNKIASSSQRYALDLLPASYMANGDLVQQLVQSDMVRTMEFQYLGGFFFLEPQATSARDGVEGPHLVNVPLTRSDIFSTNAVGLLEKRRVMMFVKDVEASLAQQTHAKTASPADSVEMQKAAAAAAAAQAANAFAKELEGKPDMTLSELLAKKYGLSGRALDIITLMGQLDDPPRREGGEEGEEAEEVGGTGAGLLRAVQLVRELLTSVGTFGSSTPFLIPAYGASELPQSTCRTAAVWGAVYVLQRGLARVVVDAEKEMQYAVLTNGQHIPARVIVAPEELLRAVPAAPTAESRRVLPVRFSGWQNVLALEKRRASGTLHEGLTKADLAALVASGGDTQFSRVIVIAAKPLFTRQGIHIAKGESAASDADARAGEQTEEEEAPPPVVMALTRVGDAADAPVVHVVQQSSTCEQVWPRHSPHVILHFTANAAALSQDALEAAVLERFLSAGSATGLQLEADVLFMASFTLSGMQIALDTIYGDDDGSDSHGGATNRAPRIVDVPSATRDTHPFAVGECAKLQQAVENDRRRVLHEGVAEKTEAEEQESLEAEEKKTAHDTAVKGSRPKSSPFLRLVGVPTFASVSLLNDGQAMRAARAAFRKIVACVTDETERTKESFVFLEKQPPLPAPTQAAE